MPLPRKIYKHGFVAFVFALCWVMNAFCEETPINLDIDQGPGRKHMLVIGRVSKNPKKHYHNLKPIVDYVAEQMQDLDIKETRVLFASNNQQMISYLRQGKIDWITETPFSASIYEEKGVAEILLLRRKKGVPEYFTVFFSRKDSGITSLQGLKGKTIVFEDPGSTTAYFLPAATLIKAGLILVQLAAPREKPPENMVGYVFAGQELNMSTWVYKGLADAGAFSNLDWKDSDRTIQNYKQQMKIFYKTKPIPRSLELVRKDLRPEIKSRLKDILLNAHRIPAGKDALKAYQKTEKFENIIGRMLDNLNYLRELSGTVRKELM